MLLENVINPSDPRMGFTGVKTMPKYVSTNEAAELLGLRPQTLRKRYCNTGQFYCIRPIKCQNGKLRWPVDALEQFMEGK